MSFFVVYEQRGATSSGGIPTAGYLVVGKTGFAASVDAQAEIKRMKRRLKRSGADASPNAAAECSIVEAENVVEATLRASGLPRVRSQRPAA